MIFHIFTIMLYFLSDEFLDVITKKYFMDLLIIHLIVIENIVQNIM